MAQPPRRTRGERDKVIVGKRDSYHNRVIEVPFPRWERCEASTPGVEDRMWEISSGISSHFAETSHTNGYDNPNLFYWLEDIQTLTPQIGVRGRL